MSESLPRNALFGALAVLALTLTVCVVIITTDIHSTMKQTQGTLGTLDRTATDIQEYVSKQKTVLESEKNQKSLEAGWQTAAVLNGTLRLINTQTIPRVNRGLDSTDQLVRSIKVTNDNLATLIRNTDREVNDKLLPQATELLAGLTATADKFGLTADETAQAIKLASEKLNVSLETMNKLISDPAWKQTLDNINTTTSNVAVATGNLAEASKQAPSIAQSLEKIAKTSSRFTKVTLVSNIVATLARAFLP